MKCILNLLTLSFCILFFTACQKDKEPLDLPSTYLSANYDTNTAVEYDVRSKLAAFTALAKTGNTPGTVVDFGELEAAFTTGNPSLEAVTTSYFSDQATGADGWIKELSNASGTAWTPGTTVGNGGTYGAYLFTEQGLEHTQLLDKGLYSATFYNHAVSLMKGALSAATVDQIIAAFGAHPDFPNTPNATSNPDVNMANYTARRDKADGNGLYTQFRDACIKLKAAIEAGEEYTEERDEALTTIQNTWEKAAFATVIYYCASAISKFSATAADETTLASGLHAYAEAVGFAHGFRTIDANYKIITDAQIDELLTILNAPANGEATSYTFVTDPINEVPKLTEAIEFVQGIYGFTDQEVTDFEVNWVAIQGR